MRRAFILGLVLALAGGCATTKESSVTQVAPRGSYLDASFATSSGVWRFELASRIGVAGTYDVVAMVSNDDTCRPVAESGASTLVFLQSGSPAFLLGRCPVLAFARPL
jgi:hypothetical protein